jgi:small nuclear ribonucleoprotein (snRNP)-like protein
MVYWLTHLETEADMDQVLLVSILLIFLTALFSNVLRQRKKDRVLKDLQGFHVTMHLLNDKQVWGKMRVFSNGLELLYSDPHRNSNGEMTSSYILYQEEIEDIWLFYRYHSELSDENRIRRQLEVQNTIYPGFFSRFKRASRNFLNAFNDAINEALGVFLNRLKGAGASTLIASQDQYLKKVGASALGMVGSIFNPILERYINRRVVVVVTHDKRTDEYCGFLKEYSPNWISLLDCRVRRKHKLKIQDIERMSMQRDIDMEILISEDDGRIVLDVLISYFGAHTLKLIGIKGLLKSEGYYRKIGKVLGRKGSLSLRLGDLPAVYTQRISSKHLPLQFSMIAPERREGDMPVENEVYQELLPELEMIFYTERIADVYIPRSIGTLRNGAESMDE